LAGPVRAARRHVAASIVPTSCFANA
jgi:hypothetical protein